MTPRIYFFCCNEIGNLQEDVIALAEGLATLGIPYYSNCDYWQRSTRDRDYVFRHSPDVSPQDCDVVVVSYTWPLWVRMGDFRVRRQPLPPIFQKGRKYITVFMDNFDGYRTVSWEPEFRQFDLILRSKYNQATWHPENCRPWAYGLNERIISATENSAPFEHRKQKILVNFGASHNVIYGARVLARRKFEKQISGRMQIDYTVDDLSMVPSDPYERLMWVQTGGRFNRDYYERLKTTKAVACFCGDIIPGLPFESADSYLVGGGKAILRREAYAILAMLMRKNPRAVGWDSFRFWEAFAASCVAVNIDLDWYGALMPEMPINGRHYIGVRFDRIDDSIGVLQQTDDSLGAIAAAGRRWAELNYSPSAVAHRFLQVLGLVR